MKSIFLRSAHNYDADAVSAETGQDFTGEVSMTQQNFADDADINTIVKRFGITGQLPNGVAMPQSGEFSDVTDFHTAMNLVKAAETAFMAIPAETRARFGHDPGKVMQFLDDANNREEAIKLGLIEKPKEVPREPPQQAGTPEPKT